MILAGVVFLLQLAVLYVPFLQNIFYTRPLLLQDLAISLALSSLVFWMIELEKWFIRRKEASTR
jgi:Ca2+-transporting ATPase